MATGLLAIGVVLIAVLLMGGAAWVIAQLDETETFLRGIRIAQERDWERNIMLDNYADAERYFEMQANEGRKAMTTDERRAAMLADRERALEGYTSVPGYRRLSAAEAASLPDAIKALIETIHGRSPESDEHSTSGGK